MLTAIYYDGNQNRLYRSVNYKDAADMRDYIEGSGDNEVITIIEGNPELWLDIQEEDLINISSSSMSD